MNIHPENDLPLPLEIPDVEEILVTNQTAHALDDYLNHKLPIGALKAVMLNAPRRNAGKHFPSVVPPDTIAMVVFRDGRGATITEPGFDDRRREAARDKDKKAVAPRAGRQRRVFITNVLELKEDES